MKKKTCTRATLEFDSREVPGYPKFTLCSLKWGHDVPSEFQGGCCNFITPSITSRGPLCRLCSAFFLSNRWTLKVEIYRIEGVFYVEWQLTKPCFFSDSPSHEWSNGNKTLMTSYCTDWFIGILTMASTDKWVVFHSVYSIA